MPNEISGKTEASVPNSYLIHFPHNSFSWKKSHPKTFLNLVGTRELEPIGPG